MAYNFTSSKMTSLMSPIYFDEIPFDSSMTIFRVHGKRIYRLCKSHQIFTTATCKCYELAISRVSIWAHHHLEMWTRVVCFLVSIVYGLCKSPTKRRSLRQNLHSNAWLIRFWRWLINKPSICSKEWKILYQVLWFSFQWIDLIFLVNGLYF